MLAYEGKEAKIYSPLEHERIRMACGLEPPNYDVGRPPIYGMILAEGRSMVKVEAGFAVIVLSCLLLWRGCSLHPGGMKAAPAAEDDRYKHPPKLH